MTKVQKGENRFFKGITTGNFPNLEKDINMQVQEGLIFKSAMCTSRHIIIILSKKKEKKNIPRTGIEKKQMAHKVVPIQLTTNFSFSQKPYRPGESRKRFFVVLMENNC
jgi:hypothetical protein